MRWRWRSGPGRESWKDSCTTAIAEPVPIDLLHRAPGRGRWGDYVGSLGDSYDNAMAESIIDLYKVEVIRRRGPWKGIDDVEYATLEWVDWFNHRRLLEPIGDVPPAEFEDVYRRREDSRAAVRLNETSLR